MIQLDLKIYDEISALRAEFRDLFGHEMTHSAYFLTPTEDRPALLRQVLNAKDESILDSLFLPVPLDADI